ncbi:tetratricopeptide repeat protein [Nocardia sp. NPDC050793]|uniref:tetratricopeptide repeat protein n=1 Tax=Nocardia sp. NPDC050793 TaxID=3155159 RepID=UPI0033C14BF2
MTTFAHDEVVRAKVLIDFGRIDAARVKLGAVLAADPDNADALMLMGYAWFRVGEYEKSVGFSAAALAAFPDYQSALRVLALAEQELAHLAEDDSAERQRHYDRALAAATPQRGTGPGVRREPAPARGGPVGDGPGRRAGDHRPGHRDRPRPRRSAPRPRFDPAAWRDLRAGRGSGAARGASAATRARRRHPGARAARPGPRRARSGRARLAPCRAVGSEPRRLRARDPGRSGRAGRIAGTSRARVPVHATAAGSAVPAGDAASELASLGGVGVRRHCGAAPDFHRREHAARTGSAAPVAVAAFSDADCPAVFAVGALSAADAAPLAYGFPPAWPDTAACAVPHAPDDSAAAGDAAAGDALSAALRPRAGAFTALGSAARQETAARTGANNAPSAEVICPTARSTGPSGWKR